jgi:CubicO group peptidase (beta-lactamase class C family)
MKPTTLQNLLLALACVTSLSAHAQSSGKVTLDQVQKAIEQLDAMAQKEIDESAVPGLAIAVVRSNH